MKKVVLISCASKKLKQKAKAKNMYISPLFKLSLEYATSLKPDKIFVLSAKYCLLDLEQEIEPYSITLNNMKDKDINEWAEKILKQLEKEANLQEDEFILLAGNKYIKYLIPKIKNYKNPLKNLGIGKRLKFLKENVRRM